MRLATATDVADVLAAQMHRVDTALIGPEDDFQRQPRHRANGVSLPVCASKLPHPECPEFIFRELDQGLAARVRHRTYAPSTPAVAIRLR